MSNRFSNFVPQEYVSTYVPLPLEFMANTLANKQKSFDDSLDAADKVEDEILKVNAIDDHQPIKQKLVNQYKSEVQSLADEIAKTGDTSKMRELKRIANRWQNDATRNELETSYGQWKLDEKDILKLTSEGKYDDQTYNPRLGWKGIDDQGNIIGYRAKGVKPIQDYYTLGDKLMKGIASSGHSGKDYVINSDGSITGRSSGWKAVYEQDVNRVVQESLPAFLKDPAGQYFIDEYRAKRNPNASSEEIANAAYRYLKGIGSKQIFSETSGGRDYQGWTPEHVTAGNKLVPYFETEGDKLKSRGFNVNLLNFMPPGEDFYLTGFTEEERNRINKDQTGLVEEQLRKEKGLNSKNSKDPVYFQPYGLPEREKEFVLEFAKSNYPDLYNKIKNKTKLSVEELTNLYTRIKPAMIENNKDVEANAGYTPILQKDANNLNDMYFNNKEGQELAKVNKAGANAKYYIPSLDKEMSLKELIDEFGADANIAITGEYDAKNPYVIASGGNKGFANAKQVTIIPKEGETINGVVSGPKSYGDRNADLELRFNEVTNELNSMRYFNKNLPTVKNVYGDDYEILFTPVNETGDGIWSAKNKNTGKVIDNFNGNRIFKADDLNKLIIEDARTTSK